MAQTSSIDNAYLPYRLWIHFSGRPLRESPRRDLDEAAGNGTKQGLHITRGILGVASPARPRSFVHEDRSTSAALATLYA